MKITAKYDRKDFFGNNVYTEDYTYTCSTKSTLETLTKCQKSITDREKFEFTVMINFEADEFQRFEPNKILKEAGAEECDTICIWQECTDRDKNLITVRASERGNWQETKFSRNKLGSVMRCIAAAVDMPDDEYVPLF